ncbi:DUF364 domain-containing protein [Candidatus Sumerlaeota bacterium]|nr:DUF364 domain-containing protein [Candidatus Sumerlaeota bacterium]
MTIQDVVVGRRFCAVVLSDGAMGVANISPDGCGEPLPEVRDHVPPPGTPAGDGLASLGSHERGAIGLATANALANRSVREGGRWDERLIGGDLLEAIELRSDDHLGMVGCFQPLVDLIRQRVKRLTIFERAARQAPGLLPDSRAFEVLPDCSIALITATALINGTIDALLSAAADCREVVVLGPSTPLAPEVFGGSPRATLLCGVVATDRAGLLCAVAAGGGTRDFQPFVAKVNVRVPEVHGSSRGDVT